MTEMHRHPQTIYLVCGGGYQIMIIIDDPCFCFTFLQSSNSKKKKKKYYGGLLPCSTHRWGHHGHSADINNYCILRFIPDDQPSKTNNNNCFQDVFLDKIHIFFSFFFFLHTIITISNKLQYKVKKHGNFIIDNTTWNRMISYAGFAQFKRTNRCVTENLKSMIYSLYIYIYRYKYSLIDAGS